jgi:phospholipase/lecithinase/hemolysin
LQEKESDQTEQLVKKQLLDCCVQKLIGEGATTVIVSGISPMGCAPGNLVLLGSQNKADYEPGTGCLRALNLLSQSHNSQLRGALSRLAGRHPGARITYADLYAPIIAFAAAPARYGFDGADGALRACCGGGGGRYNFNLDAACGMPGVSACARPSAYVNWDGVHLTEAANHRVADGWLRGPYANPPILSS